MDLATKEISVLPPEECHGLTKQYEKLALARYRECNYPEYNVWRSFHREEAEKVRPLSSEGALVFIKNRDRI